MPLRLTGRQWQAILRWFVRGLPSAQIAAETGLERKRVLRALTIVRAAILRATPEGALQGAERYAARRLRPRSAAFGLYAREDRLGVRVLPETVTETIRVALRARRIGELAMLPPLHDYAAVVTRNRLYRLRPPGNGSGSFGQIEAFWSYLQRQLRARGGIRGERLALHLAEFAWRYNRRRLPPREQVRELLRAVRQSRWHEQD